MLSVGIAAGGLAVLADPDGSVGQDLVAFSPTVFFVGLLPPVRRPGQPPPQSLLRTRLG